MSLFMRMKDSNNMKKRKHRRKKHKAGLNRLIRMEAFDYGDVSYEFDATWTESSQSEYSHYRDSILEQVDT